LRVRVFYHDKCFDGACSASLFTRFHRECIAPSGAAYEYHGLVHRAGALFDESDFTGDENAIVDFKYSPSPKITWWFDHHQSAFLTAQIAQAAQTPGKAAVDNRLKQAADLLRSWDGRMTADSPAASIVFRTRQALWPLILQPKLGNAWDSYSWAESNFAEEEIIMHGSATTASTSGGPSTPSEWLPPDFPNWDALLTEAVRRGLDSGKAPDDLARWKFGSWHVVDLEHPIFGMLPIVKSWAGTGEQPLVGDSVTIKQVGRAFGPSQRFTMDWSAPDTSTENITLGQSGNPLSPWFRDQWPAWYNGTTFPLPFSQHAVASQTAHTLQLVP